MATTFAFYLDSGLTNVVQVATPINFSQKVGATDPQDATVYFGSTTANRQARAASNPGVDNLVVSVVNVITTWAGTTAKIAGNYVVPTVWNGYKYRCTVGGTTGGTQPTWPTTVGNTVVDGTVTWICEKAHATTEVKLAATQGGLAAGGQTLSLGTTVSSGTVNAKPVWIRVSDTTDVVSLFTELQLSLNTVNEYAV
jgi:hypothetical protein